MPSNAAAMSPAMRMRADFSRVPTRYDFALAFPQNRTDAVLSARLRAPGLDLR